MQVGDATRRGVPKCDGIYIRGLVEGVSIYYAVDTGAATTIVSTDLYNRIPKEQRPELSPSRPLNVADGRPLETLGRGIFNMQIGPLEYRGDMTVAGISDDVLLGRDFIQNGSKGPADLILSKGQMVLNGVSIPLLVGSQGKIKKAYAADHYVIPPLSEMTLDENVDSDPSEYRPGRKNETADALSRCPNPRECESAIRSCSKREKRSQEMCSSLANDSPTEVTRVASKTPSMVSNTITKCRQTVSGLLAALVLMSGLFHLSDAISGFCCDDASDDKLDARRLGTRPTWIDFMEDDGRTRPKLAEDDGRTRPKLAGNQSEQWSATTMEPPSYRGCCKL